MAKKANYYPIRNERAKALGFKSYAEQRKYRKQVDEMRWLSPRARKFLKSKPKDEIDRVIRAQEHAWDSPGDLATFKELEAAVDYESDPRFEAFRKAYKKGQ